MFWSILRGISISAVNNLIFHKNVSENLQVCWLSNVSVCAELQEHYQQRVDGTSANFLLIIPHLWGLSYFYFKTTLSCSPLITGDQGNMVYEHPCELMKTEHHIWDMNTDYHTSKADEHFHTCMAYKHWLPFTGVHLRTLARMGEGWSRTLTGLRLRTKISRLLSMEVKEDWLASMEYERWLPLMEAQNFKNTSQGSCSRTLIGLRLRTMITVHGS